MKLTWTTISGPAKAPTTPGVYQYVRGREILYIGKSVNLRARLGSHAQNARHDPHERLVVSSATRIRYTLTDSDFLATLLEAKLIAEHLPRYNRILRDDKSYLYIVLNLADPFPKPRLIRARDLPSGSDPVGVHLFGPFQSRKIAEDILRTIRRLIPFCQQNRVGTRACFYHKLGLCDPCPSKIDKDRIFAQKYRRQIRQIISILSGNLTPVIKDLELQLKQASIKEDYELALTLRNRLTRFESNLKTHAYTPQLSFSNSEIALQELQQLLIENYKLKIKLQRIEAYDASTFQLHHSVVSLVVAIDGQLDHSQYRRFKIKNPRANSDFAMLFEALERRLKNTRWPRPDLLVIDGGRPQLRKLQPLLDQIENPPLILGLAKHPDRIVLYPDTTISLPLASPALHLLERLRDEAHRFANSYRKTLENRQNQL